MFEQFVIFLNGVGFVADHNLTTTLEIEDAFTWDDKIQAEFWAAGCINQQYIVLQVVSED